MKKSYFLVLLATASLTACNTDNNFLNGEPPWGDMPGQPRREAPGQEEQPAEEEVSPGVLGRPYTR